MTTPLLKLKKASVDLKQPWADDTLSRETVANALTNVLKDETNPLVIGFNRGLIGGLGLIGTFPV